MQDFLWRGTVSIATLPALAMADFRRKLKGPKQMGRKTRV
jgi:hypothetical protein